MKTHCFKSNAAPFSPALLAVLCILFLGTGARAGGPVWPVDPTTLPDHASTGLPPSVPPRSTVVPAAVLQPLPDREHMNSTAARAKSLYSFQAVDLDLKTALAMFAHANNLNIVPDNDIAGTVTMDVHGLSLEEMMRAFLEAGDCNWREEGGLIRVRNRETRTFSVDYLRLSRRGTGQNNATLGSGSSSGGAGGGGGSSGGGGSGGSGGVTSVGTSFSFGGSSMNLTADNMVDFWKELRLEIGFMLSEDGKKTLAINMTAGLIQITDRPSALKRVENYLNAVTQSVHRQVDIEARIYDVELNNQFQFGIDWSHVVEAYGGALAFGGATLPLANGGAQLADSALGGLGTVPVNGTALPVGANIATLVFSNFNTGAAVNALSEQGKVEVIAKPRIRTLNNQTALIKVGEDRPFFNTSVTVEPTTVGNPILLSDTTISSVTIGTILSITPQISDDDWIVLDISPVLTSLLQTLAPPSASTGGASTGTTGGVTAPDLETKMASSLVRVRDGTTVVIGGLIQTQISKNNNKIPLLGDIPYLGKLFQGTFDSKTKTELVIFVTPHIVREGEAGAVPPPEAELFPKSGNKKEAGLAGTQ